MGLRFRRSLHLIPGVRLNMSRSGISASFGRRGAWFTVEPKGTRATIGIPGTGLSYTEQSPWTKSPRAPTASGIEVTELPREEIEIPAVASPAPAPASDATAVDDSDLRDRRLGPIMLVIVAIIAAVAVLWALLV